MNGPVPIGFFSKPNGRRRTIDEVDSDMPLELMFTGSSPEVELATELIAAGLAVIGAVVNFAFGRPAIRLIGSAAAFLTVSALWRLVVSMM